MSNNNVTLHRVLTAPPEKVFRAFSDANALFSWLPPYGFIGKVQHMDFKEKGTYKGSFINFTTGNEQGFGGKYLEIKTNEFIQYTDKFDDPNLPGEMTVTVRLKKVSVGTELHIVHEGIPEAIPAESCYLGWQESLEKLKKLTEADVKDA